MNCYFQMVNYIAILVSHVVVAVLFYFFGKMAKKRTKLLLRRKKEEAASEVKDPDLLYRSLMQYFTTEKPYLNPDLDEKEVTQRLLTNRTYLSRAIKENGAVNFNVFVNSYRIREAIDIFRMDPRARVGETAVKCGFNSSAAFSMAFKSALGVSPRQWKEVNVTAASVLASAPLPQTRHTSQAHKDTPVRTEACRL